MLESLSTSVGLAMTNIASTRPSSLTREIWTGIEQTLLPGRTNL